MFIITIGSNPPLNTKVTNTPGQFIRVFDTFGEAEAYRKQMIYPGTIHEKTETEILVWVKTYNMAGTLNNKTKETKNYDNHN